MSFTKARPEDVERFERLAAGIDGVERRKMFGYPAAFVNGNMAFGLYAGRIMLRLPKAVRDRLIESGWKPFEVMPGRVMHEYLSLPGGINAADEEARSWLQRSADYTRALPPKAATQQPKRGA